MWSIADLRERSRTAARKTAQEGLRPYVVEADDLADLHLTVRAGVVPTLPFPLLDDHQLPGFQPTENRYFVDSSFDPGAGAALTVQAFGEPLRFLKYLREGYAYAVVKAGRCYVQEYIPALTSEAMQGGAMTCLPLLAQVTAALLRGEEMRDEVTEVFRCLEELQQRLTRRMAFLREAEQHLRRGGDLTVEARKVIERISVAPNGTSEALGASPELLIQSAATGHLAMNPNPVPETN